MKEIQTAKCDTNPVMNRIHIEPAVKADAYLIGQTIVEAIGIELAEDFAGGRTVDDVVRLFAILAAREDSQYSYRNSLKAVDDDGNPMGFIVGYDGAMLQGLRVAFFEEVKRILGKDMEGKMDDETSPDEFYLDSLAVFPLYRGRGVAKALIEAMCRRAEKVGKPVGLLCDKGNVNARRLYDSLGFRLKGERKFAGEPMDHLQKG